jgi:hypothetical protein
MPLIEISSITLPVQRSTSSRGCRSLSPTRFVLPRTTDLSRLSSGNAATERPCCPTRHGVQG